MRLAALLLMALPCVAQNGRYGSTVNAELPRVTVDDSYPDTTGYATKTVCASGCDFTTLSAAWAAAICSEVITMRAGQTFTGNTTITTKPCTANSQIVIRSDSGSCPAKGTRVTPRDAAAMATLVTATLNTPVIQTAADVGDLYLHIGPCLAFTGTKGTTLSDALINLGGTDTAAATQVGHVTLDRIYLYGPDQQRIYRRGVLLNGRYLGLVDSWFENISDSGTDAQDIASFGGSGPFKIANNTLSGGAENILFGGAHGNYVSNPADAEIFCNYVTKPSVWQKTSSTYMGILNTVKNSLEQKMGQRVHYKCNIIENEWGGQGQAGWSLVLTPRVASGQGWSMTTINDITYAFNWANKVDGGWNVACFDDAETGTPFRLQRINAHDNLLTNMVNAAMQITCPSYFTYDHGSYLTTGLVAGSGGFGIFSPSNYVSRYLKLTNSYGSAGFYTFFGSGCTQTPNAVLNTCGGVASDYTFSRSAFVDLNDTQAPLGSGDFPASNRFLADGTTTLFRATADYSDMTSATNCNAGTLTGCVITNASPFHNAGLDGKDLGADIAGVISNTANVRPTIPQITVGSISPTNGTHLGGTAVTITGTNFFTGGGLTMVIIGGNANSDTGAECTSVVVVSSTSITCTTAAYSGTTGIATNVVVFNGGSYTSFSGYTFN